MKVNEGYYICQPGSGHISAYFGEFQQVFPLQRIRQKLRFPLFRVNPATDHGRIGNQSAAHQKPAHVIR